ncbi:class I SAM-dependent methyltransferase [Nitratireductor mangrovi]|uniref:Class I SAM-dependent methyltransferase n=1 Tax=Nitratireductor mangrovi TaxID=2599600 RepID=A0A5B8L2G4_9HYPH|nr:class I SAM-dependent methyltransferase [Nitratireductor mangrovi]QDZ01708.1 class I SAM-dependent methyltransferase [Nitratireductor mangrovi]
MTDDSPSPRPLDLVYAASSEAELADAYAAWAASYDRETAELGYCLPFLITGWLARHVPAGAGPILDAGCGTGLSGPFLKALGYDRLAGLDLSEEMLTIARSRNAYGELKKAALGEPLPWPDGHFRAFIAAGVFTAGHAPASGLDELARITAPGGHAIFTVRDLLIDSAGFRERFDALTAAGKWRPVEESQPFRAFAVGEPDVLVKSFVFQVG